MFLPRLFTTCPIILKTPLALTQEKHHYLKHVLRASVGDSLVCFNGQGGEYLCELVALTKKDAIVMPMEKRAGILEPTCRIILAQGVSQGERMDYAIQKSVELGVFAIQPLLTDKVKGMKKARLLSKQAHWQRVAISAAEQSGRTYVPSVHDPIDFDTFISMPHEQVLFALPGAKNSLKDLSLNIEQSITCVIGPESGFSEREVEVVQSQGWECVTLGPRVLRTETAAACMLSWLSLVP